MTRPVTYVINAYLLIVIIAIIAMGLKRMSYGTQTLLYIYHYYSYSMLKWLT